VRFGQSNGTVITQLKNYCIIKDCRIVTDIFFIQKSVQIRLVDISGIEYYEITIKVFNSDNNKYNKLRFHKQCVKVVISGKIKGCNSSKKRKKNPLVFGSSISFSYNFRVKLATFRFVKRIPIS